MASIVTKIFFTPIVLIGALLFPLAATAEDASFTDVGNTGSYGPYIQDLEQKGVIEGEADGMFDPQKAITRAEFVKIVVSGFQLPLDHGHFHFVDMNDHWAAQYVQSAWNQGIVEGTDDYTFSPDVPIKREEAATIVWRLLNAKGMNPSAIRFMLTNNVDSWAREGVSQCMAKNLFGVQFSSGTYQDSLDREGAAALVDSSIIALNNTSATVKGLKFFNP